MSSGVSDYGANAWLAGLFGLATLPDSYWVALCTVEPGAAMDGDMLADIEPPTAAAYARQSYSTGDSWWGINGAYLTNTGDITFPAPTDDWGYITHYALCTAATSGQIYAWGEFLNPQQIDSGVGATIPGGAVVIGLHALDNTFAA